MTRVLPPAIALLATMTVACPDGERTPAAATATDAGEVLPQPFSFGAETGSMLFSALDAAGEPVTADKIDGIPEPMRARVMVVDLSRSPEQRQADRYVFFADLTHADAQGRYTAHPMSRYRTPPRRAAGEVGGAGGSGEVVIYTTPWCGFCKKAKAYLQRKGVAFTERDVEASAAAARELEAKLRAAGAAGGGVPVIDIGGSLVMGFDQARIDELLARKGAASAPTP